MSITTGTFPGVRIVDMPDLGAVNDGSSFVGERAGSGRFNALALRDYVAASLGFIDVRVYGAKGDSATDDTAAIQAAVNAVPARGAIVFLPGGCYKISAAITAPLNGKVWFRGEGLGTSILRQTNATADGIVFTRDNYLTTGGGVSDMTIEAGAGLECGGFFGSGSSGTGLRVTRANDNFVTNNLGINNFGTGLALVGCWNTCHANLRIMFTAGDAIFIGRSGAIVAGGNSISTAKISNSGYAGTNTGSVGVRITASGGEYLSDVDVTSTNVGIALVAETGYQVLYLFFNDVLADTCLSHGWFIDGAAANVWSIYCTTCWSSFNGGHGVCVQGTHVKDVQWTAGRLRENALAGLFMATGGVTVTGGAIVHNSRGNDNVNPGVRVEPNVSDWALIGVRIGNDGQATAVQAEAIEIAVGTSDRYRIVGCDLSLPGPGKVPLLEGATQQQTMLSSNLPIGVNALNTYSAEMLASCSIGIAAATTTFLGPTGAQATEGYASWVIPRAAAASLLTVKATVPPGAGQSFTFMLRKNYTDTAMTGTITGTSFFLEISSIAVGLAAGDIISLRLVTSATAAVSAFQYAIRVE